MCVWGGGVRCEVLETPTAKWTFNNSASQNADKIWQTHAVSTCTSMLIYWSRFWVVSGCGQKGIVLQTTQREGLECRYLVMSTDNVDSWPHPFCFFFHPVSRGCMPSRHWIAKTRANQRHNRFNVNSTVCIRSYYVISTTNILSLPYLVNRYNSFNRNQVTCISHFLFHFPKCAWIWKKKRKKGKGPTAMAGVSLPSANSLFTCASALLRPSVYSIIEWFVAPFTFLEASSGHRGHCSSSVVDSSIRRFHLHASIRTEGGELWRPQQTGRQRYCVQWVASNSWTICRCFWAPGVDCVSGHHRGFNLLTALFLSQNRSIEWWAWTIDLGNGIWEQLG